MVGYLTPDANPVGATCRVLFLPDDERWIATIEGAINQLAEPENWQKYGTLTPQEAADFWVNFCDQFCFTEGTCKVVGEIVTFAGTTSPDAKWLTCDGASLVRADYPDLFTVIGTTYGSADGTHFNIPDLQGRSPIGTGSGSGLTPRSLGDSFGEETHTLDTSEIPSHTHTDVGHTHTEGTAFPAVGAAIVGVPIPSAVPSVGVTGAGFASLSNTGGGGAHNNLSPALALSYFIVALP